MYIVIHLLGGGIAFLANAKSVAPEKLSGIIEADETYFLKSEKGNKKLNRKPRVNGEGKHHKEA